MANPGAVEVGFNEETLDAIRTLQRTVDRFTPDAGGGFAEVPGDTWTDRHFIPTRIYVQDVEDGYINIDVRFGSEDQTDIPIVIRDAYILDELIGLLIHLRRRAFGHE
jgi:hypothetical protein